MLDPRNLDASPETPGEETVQLFKSFTIQEVHANRVHFHAVCKPGYDSLSSPSSDDDDDEEEDDEGKGL